MLKIQEGKKLTGTEILELLAQASNVITDGEYTIVSSISYLIEKYEAENKVIFGEIKKERIFDESFFDYNYIYHFVAHDVYLKQQGNECKCNDCHYSNECIAFYEDFQPFEVKPKKVLTTIYVNV